MYPKNLRNTGMDLIAKRNVINDVERNLVRATNRTNLTQYFVKIQKRLNENSTRKIKLVKA